MPRTPDPSPGGRTLRIALVLVALVALAQPAHADSPEPPLKVAQTVNAWDAQPAILWLSTERWHAAEPKPAKKAALRAHSEAAVYGSGACGGDLPPCWVMNRESRGNIYAYNPTGCGGDGCYGKWQCDPDSCDGTGTEAEQDAEAARLWNGGAGCANWGAC